MSRTLRCSFSLLLLVALCAIELPARAQTIVWRSEDTGTNGLSGVAGFDDGWAAGVGADGTVVLRDPGGAWTTLPPPTPAALYDIHGPSKDLFAVGGDGYVGVYDHGTWIDVSEDPGPVTPVHMTPDGLVMWGVPGSPPAICRLRLGVDSQPLCAFGGQWVLGLCGDSSPLTSVDVGGDVFTVTAPLLEKTPVHDSAVHQDLARVDFDPSCTTLFGFRQPTPSAAQVFGLDLSVEEAEWEGIGSFAFEFGASAILGPSPELPFLQVVGEDVVEGGGDVRQVCAESDCTLFGFPSPLSTASDLTRVGEQLLAITEGAEAVVGTVFPAASRAIDTAFDDLGIGLAHGQTGSDGEVLVSSPAEAAGFAVREAAPGDLVVDLDHVDLATGIIGSHTLASGTGEVFVKGHLDCVDGGRLKVDLSGMTTFGLYGMISVADDVSIHFRCEMLFGDVWQARLQLVEIGGEVTEMGVLNLPAQHSEICLHLAKSESLWRVSALSETDVVRFSFVSASLQGVDVIAAGFGLEAGESRLGGTGPPSFTLTRFFLDSAFFADGFESGDTSAWAP